jgi:hypothetical protein
MRNKEGFDAGAAVTRSLLGWGVVVGPFYLVVGLLLALTRDGFDLTRHQLSLLMLGDGGWMQTANLIVSGLMTLAAAVGFARAPAETAADIASATRTASMLGVYGLGVVGSGLFPPDPMGGFPPGAPEGASVGGILHLVFGLVQFVALVVATFVFAGCCSRRGDRAVARYSRTSGVVVLAGFVGGAALAASPVGVGLLWLAVVAGWGWLLVASARTYRTVPHPDADRRVSGTS